MAFRWNLFLPAIEIEQPKKETPLGNHPKKRSPKRPWPKKKTPPGGIESYNQSICTDVHVHVYEYNFASDLRVCHALVYTSIIRMHM